MKKSLKIIIGIVLLASLSIGTYFLYPILKNKKHASHSKEIYTCPMHPEIIKNKSGSCPICNMDLVLKPSDHSSHSEEIYVCPMHPEIIKNESGSCPNCNMDLVLKPSSHQNEDETHFQELDFPTNHSFIGDYQTIYPIDTLLITDISLPGSIAYDPNSVITISARMSGRLEKMNVKYKFQNIRKGEILFEIYSPELLTEQQNYLYNLKENQSNTNLINASKEKLLLYGMTQKQVSDLENTKQTNPTIAIYSPVEGTILGAGNEGMKTGMGMSSANQGTQGLSLKEGSYIEKNTPIFSIANTTKVWGIFNILQGYTNLVKKNTTINITTEFSKQTHFRAKVNFIETQLAENEKTNRLRVYIDNHKLKLPIGTRLEGELKSKAVHGIFITKTSIITLGSKHIVFIKKENKFYAKEIKIGNELKGYVQVLSGLNTHDKIALNALYLTDSESFIKIKK